MALLYLKYFGYKNLQLQGLIISFSVHKSPQSTLPKQQQIPRTKVYQSSFWLFFPPCIASCRARKASANPPASETLLLLAVRSLLGVPRPLSGVPRLMPLSLGAGGASGFFVTGLLAGGAGGLGLPFVAGGGASSLR